MVKELLQASGEMVNEKLVAKTRQKNPLWNYGWYILGLPAILTVSVLIAWSGFTIHTEALPMFAMVTVLYIGICVHRFQLHAYRSYRAIGISAFYNTVGFLAIFALLALFRLYYSRSFLASAYGITMIWTVLGVLLFRRRKQSYVIIAGGLADQLRSFANPYWEFVKDIQNVESVDNCDGVVVDLHAQDEENILSVMADFAFHGVPIVHAASVLERYSGRTNLQYLVHEGLYKLNTGWEYSLIKRVWEVALILLFTPVIIPIMVVTAVAIKIDSKGAIFFRQQRIGKDDEPFTLYKFRSMITDAEKNGSRFAEESDSRVTDVGSFIRKFRIDELPQLWNVLRGDMSLIGPRPEQPKFVEYFEEEIPFYSYRHNVRPGITGWAQVNDGYAAGIEETKTKLEFDLYYLKNISLSLDLLIVYATIKTILTGFGSR